MDTKSGNIDSFDRKIIQILAAEGRISISDLAKQVGLSNTPCHNRLRRLLDQGYILGFRAILNPEKLGREHVAFVEVKLEDTREKALRAFADAVYAIPEIEQCHMIAGAFDFLLKIRTKNIQDYRRVLGEHLSTLPHVANTSTHVSMQAVKDTAF